MRTIAQSLVRSWEQISGARKLKSWNCREWACSATGKLESQRNVFTVPSKQPSTSSFQIHLVRTLPYRDRWRYKNVRRKSINSQSGHFSHGDKINTSERRRFADTFIYMRMKTKFLMTKTRRRTQRQTELQRRVFIYIYKPRWGRRRGRTSRV